MYVNVHSTHGTMRPLLGSPNKATTSSGVRPGRSLDFNCSSLGKARTEQHAKSETAKNEPYFTPFGVTDFQSTSLRHETPVYFSVVFAADVFLDELGERLRLVFHEIMHAARNQFRFNVCPSMGPQVGCNLWKQFCKR